MRATSRQVATSISDVLAGYERRVGGSSPVTAGSALIGSVDPLSVYLSVVTLGEIARGIVLKQTKDSAASSRLALWLQELRREFSQRTIVVDDTVAIETGRITAGRTRGSANCMIAATAMVHKMTLVTRNVVDFHDLPLAIVNRWQKS